MPKHDDDPPRSKRADTRYAKYDDRSLWVHVADRVDEMYQEWPEIKASVLAQTRMETKLDVAVGLIQPWHKRYAPAALVVLVAIFVFTYVSRGTASATVPEPSPRVQAGR